MGKTEVLEKFFDNLSSKRYSLIFNGNDNVIIINDVVLLFFTYSDCFQPKLYKEGYNRPTQVTKQCGESK